MRAVHISIPETGEELVTFLGHEGGVNSVAFSRDGTRLVSAGYETIRLWETRSHTQLLNDLRLARARVAGLEPLVIEWVDDDNNNNDITIVNLTSSVSADAAAPAAETSSTRKSFIDALSDTLKSFLLRIRLFLLTCLSVFHALYFFINGFIQEQGSDCTPEQEAGATEVWYICAEKCRDVREKHSVYEELCRRHM